VITLIGGERQHFAQRRRARGPVAGPNRNRRESSPYSGRSPVAVRVVPKSL
jgi:hypothetical protein